LLGIRDCGLTATTIDLLGAARVDHVWDKVCLIEREAIHILQRIARREQSQDLVILPLAEWIQSRTLVASLSSKEPFPVEAGGGLGDERGVEEQGLTVGLVGVALLHVVGGVGNRGDVPVGVL
jgi:hypothetical protein